MMSDYKSYGFDEDMIAEMLYFLDWCVGHDAAFDGMTAEEAFDKYVSDYEASHRDRSAAGRDVWYAASNYAIWQLLPDGETFKEWVDMYTGQQRLSDVLEPLSDWFYDLAY